MATKTKAAPAAPQQAKSKSYEFIGKAWVNVAKVTGKGDIKVISLGFDPDVESVTITRKDGTQLTLSGADRVTLWPNNKREGKKDADLRATITLED